MKPIALLLCGVFLLFYWLGAIDQRYGLRWRIDHASDCLFGSIAAALCGILIYVGAWLAH